MRENLIAIGNGLNEIWENWYSILSNDDTKYQTSYDEVVGEVINAVTVIDNPLDNIVKSKVRNLSMKYAIGELLWYISANNSVKGISKYSKMWEKLSDDGVTVNSNYGYCIKKKFGFDQYEYVKEMLTKDKNSRQAVIHIKEPSDKQSKDVNCTVCLQFLVRNKKLYMTTYMRSNDIWLGFPYDVFNFTCLQILLSMELGLDLGSYTHIVGSLHLYKKNKKEGKF